MTSTPQISGIHHIGITVSDLELSADWYQQVLGFTELTRLEIGPMSKIMVQHGSIVLSLVSHGKTAVPGDFDEHSTGLDHLSFSVPDRAELESWAQRLDDAGVEHSGVVEGATGALIAFRDPDNIALEFYTLS